MHSYCAVFAPKPKVVILVLGYGHLLRDSGSHDTTGDSLKKCRLTYVFFHILIGFTFSSVWVAE